MRDRALLGGRLYARIIWFHLDPTTQDADNIVKPLLDALKSIVFEDDSQVGEIYTTRIDFSQDYTPQGVPVEVVVQRLGQAMTRPENHIVYLEVGAAPEQIARFGNTDEFTGI